MTQTISDDHLLDYIWCTSLDLTFPENLSMISLQSQKWSDSDFEIYHT